MRHLDTGDHRYRRSERLLPPAAVREPDEVSSEVDLRRLFSYLVHYRLIVAATTIVFTLAALFYVVGRDRLYVAETRVLVDPVGAKVVERDVVARDNSSGESTAIVESQMRVMTSETVLQKVIESENLIADPEFTESLSGPVGAMIGSVRSLFATAGPPVQPEILALFRLSEAVRATRPQQSYIVDLHVKTKEPEKSSRLANAIARAYIATDSRARSDLARRASGALNARLSQLRAALSEAENAVEQFKSEHNIVSSSGGLINEQQLDQLNRALVETRGRTTLAESNLEQIRQAVHSVRDLDNIPEALTSSTISGLRIRLAEALQRRSVLSADLLPSHPAMAAVDAQVAVVEGQIRQELDRLVGRAEAQVARARSEEEQIARQLEHITQTTFDTNDARVRLRELTREAEAKRAVYESFLLRAKELGEQEELEVSQSRIISHAVPPLRPAGLSSMLILAFGIVAGLSVGSMVALVRGYLAESRWPSEPGPAPEFEPGPELEPEPESERRLLRRSSPRRQRRMASSEWALRRQRLAEFAADRGPRVRQ